MIVESGKGVSHSLAIRTVLVVVFLWPALRAGYAQRVQLPATTPGGSPPPTYAPPASQQPDAAPAFNQPPANFQGSIAPADTWDPYSDPNAHPQGGLAAPGFGTNPQFYEQPSALFPGGGPSAFVPGGYQIPGPDGTLAASPRLFKQIRFEYEWLAGDDDLDSFEMNSVEIAGTMQFPFMFNPAPLEVTPGFAVHYLEGPRPLTASLPPQLFDAYLDTAWRPVFTNWFSADLGARIGVYSDFDNVNDDSIRIMGRGLAIFNVTPQTMQVALGVVYFDRLRTKLLPAGGVIWTPDADTRFEILFPRPRLARRFYTLGLTDWWWYVQGEYGGGAWTVERVSMFAPPTVRDDEIDYNDIRIIGGLEWRRPSGLRGYFEAGYVFDREVNFRGGAPRFKPDDTVMLRAGLLY